MLGLKLNHVSKRGSDRRRSVDLSYIIYNFQVLYVYIYIWWFSIYVILGVQIVYVTCLPWSCLHIWWKIYETYHVVPTKTTPAQTNSHTVLDCPWKAGKTRSTPVNLRRTDGSWNRTRWMMTNFCLCKPVMICHDRIGKGPILAGSCQIPVRVRQFTLNQDGYSLYCAFPPLLINTKKH